MGFLGKLVGRNLENDFLITNSVKAIIKKNVREFLECDTLIYPLYISGI